MSVKCFQQNATYSNENGKLQTSVNSKLVYITKQLLQLGFSSETLMVLFSLREKAVLLGFRDALWGFGKLL